MCRKKRNMNKVVTSAGILALGAAAVYGYDPEMTRATAGRPWTVSATVRGFYDDNPTTSPDRSVVTTPAGVTKVVRPDDSFGFEVSPSIHVNLPMEQTFIRAGYTYSLRYFEDREPHNIDQSHEFDAVLRHVFGPGHEITVSEGFIYSSEPTVLDQSGPGIFTAPRRTDESAIHNHGAIDYNLPLTQVLSLALGYANEYYDYDSNGVGSRSALLDRIEHYLRGDLRYQANEKLVALVGYQLGLSYYTGDEFLFPGTTLKSDERDSVSHFLSVGAVYDFSASLRGSVRVGGQFTDYVNANDDEVSPYADASLTYVYTRGSSVRLGVKHQRAATDIVAPDLKGRVTLDQEATSAYVELTHQITGDLTGHILGQIQYSSFNSGAANNENETLYLVGLNFNYRIDRHWGLEAGYNFDHVDSNVGNRSFERNRVYIGVRATY